MYNMITYISYFIICFFWGIYAMKKQKQIYDSTIKKCIFVGVVNMLICPVAVVFAIKGSYEMNEIIAIILYKIGVTPKMTRFIDGETLMFGYGKLNGGIGIWEYNLPEKYSAKL